VTNNELQGQRLADIMNTLNLNQSEFSRLTKVVQSHISRCLKGEKAVSNGMIVKIVRTFPNVNINRIFTGNGPVLLSDAQSFVHENGFPYGIQDQKSRLILLKKRLIQLVSEIDTIIAEN